MKRIGYRVLRSLTAITLMSVWVIMIADMLTTLNSWGIPRTQDAIAVPLCLIIPTLFLVGLTISMWQLCEREIGGPSK